VAAFAHARLGRLLLVQFIVALIVGSGIAWLLHDGFFPVVTTAIEQLPAQSEIRQGRLEWSGNSPQSLADGSFLSIAVDLNRSGEVRSLAHFQFEFGATNLLVHSLLGYSSLNYPHGWVIAFNRPELLPRWGAWRPVFLAAAISGTVIYLMVSWGIFATLYFAPVWLAGFFANRDLPLKGSWKLCGAALMPGAFAMLIVIWFYGIGMFDLVHVGFALAVHIVIGWVYLAISIFYVPLIGEADVPKNPFDSKKE
jgi:hypothetical protein